MPQFCKCLQPTFRLDHTSLYTSFTPRNFPINGEDGGINLKDVYLLVTSSVTLCNELIWKVQGTIRGTQYFLTFNKQDYS